MRISLAISAVIIIVSWMWARHADQRLHAARSHHDQLTAEITASGIPLPSISAPPAPLREAATPQHHGTSAAATIVSFAMKVMAQKAGGKMDASLPKQSLAIVELISSFTPDETNGVLAELFTVEDIPEKLRQEICGTLIQTLSQKFPPEALTLLTAYSGRLNEDTATGQIAATALANWAGADPKAAARWMTVEGAKFKHLIPEDAKQTILTAAARKSPAMAFVFMDQFNFHEPSQAIAAIVRPAGSGVQRLATLNALRDYLTAIPEETVRSQYREAGLRELAQNIGREGFATASAWTVTSELTPLELESFAAGIFVSPGSGETGPWIEWMGRTLPTGIADKTIRPLLRAWTEHDHVAAGIWLTTFPKGPCKNTAISIFAETVSKYDPEAARQWAMTLPAGAIREETLEKIRANAPLPNP